MSEFRRHLMKGVYGGGSPLPPSSQIWYTTSDNSQITLYSFGGKMVTDQTFDGEKWVVTLSGELTNVTTEFRENTLVTQVLLPTSITNIATLAFNGCTGLTKLSLFPSSNCTLGTYIWNNTKLEGKVFEAEIGENISYLSEGVFRNSDIRKLILHKTDSIVTCHTETFGNVRNCAFYLPSSLVDAYEENLVWASVLHYSRNIVVPF